MLQKKSEPPAGIKPLTFQGDIIMVSRSETHLQSVAELDKILCV